MLHVTRYTLHVITIALFLFSLVPFNVNAASLYSVQYFIDPPKASNPAINANHTITFLAPNQIASGTIVVDLSQVISGIGTVDHTDIDLIYRSAADNSLVNAVIADAAGNNIWGAAVNVGTKRVTLTYPNAAGIAIAARQTITILIGTNASGGDAQLPNSTSSGSKIGSIVAGSNIGTFAVQLSTNPNLATGATPQAETAQSTPTPASAALPLVVPPPPPPVPLPSPTPSPIETPVQLPTPTPTQTPIALPEQPKTFLEKVKEVITNFINPPKKDELKQVNIPVAPPPVKGPIDIGRGGNLVTQFVGGGGLDITFDPRTKLPEIDRRLVNLKDELRSIQKKFAPGNTSSFGELVSSLDELLETIASTKKSTVLPDAQRELEKISSQVASIRQNILLSSQEVKEIFKEIDRARTLSSTLTFQLKDSSHGVRVRGEFENKLNDVKKILTPDAPKTQEALSLVELSRQAIVDLKGDIRISEKKFPGFEKEIKPLLQKIEKDLINLVQIAERPLNRTGETHYEYVKQEAEKINTSSQKISRSLEETLKLIKSFQEVQDEGQESVKQLEESLLALRAKIDSVKGQTQQAVFVLTVSPQNLAKGSELLTQFQDQVKKISVADTYVSDVSQRMGGTIQVVAQRSQSLMAPSKQKMIRASKALNRADELLEKAIEMFFPEAFGFLRQNMKGEDQNNSTASISPHDAQFKVELTHFQQLLQRIGDAIVLYKPTGKAPVGSAFIVTAQAFKGVPLPPSVLGSEDFGGEQIPLIAFDPPLEMKFKYTKEDVEGIQEQTIKLYSWDEIEERWNQEKATLNSKEKTVIASIKHLSIFGLFGEPLPGFEHKAIIAIDSKKETEKKYLSLQEEDVQIKQATTKESMQISKGTFYATPNTEIELCIPANLFKKPVKHVVLTLDAKHYPLTFKKNEQCYGSTIKVPDKKGKQLIKIKVIYTDDSVQIINLEVVVTGELQASILSAVTPALNQFVQVAVVANEQVKATIQNTQPVLQTAAVATAPAVMAANPAVLSNSLNWYHYLNHFFSWFLSLFGFKRRKRKSWGVVYDATSKSVIDLAIVRLFDSKTNRLSETQVTDKNGRFSFLVSPGQYTLSVTKPPFVFPSQIVSGNVDGDYLHLYRGGALHIRSQEDTINISIPLDPPSKESVKGSGILKSTNSFLLHHSFGMLGLSFFVSMLLVLYTPHTINILLLGLNALFIFAQWMVLARKEKPWGIVFDSLTSEPIPLAAIAIIDAKEKKLLKTRLTDYFGRFNFFTPAGSYIISVSKDSYIFPPQEELTNSKFHNLYMGGIITVKKKRGFAKVNVPLQKIQSTSLQEVLETKSSQDVCPLQTNESNDQKIPLIQEAQKP